MCSPIVSPASISPARGTGPLKIVQKTSVMAKNDARH